jgi:hypothetical protein
VPKFLQQYAHLLGAEKADPHANDDAGWQSTAVEEGYDDEGGKVVHQFLINREREKRQSEAAEAAEAAALEQETVSAALRESGEAVGAEATPELPGKVVFKTQKREASDVSTSGEEGQSSTEVSESADVSKKKRKKKLKALDNKK